MKNTLKEKSNTNSRTPEVGYSEAEDEEDS